MDMGKQKYDKGKTSEDICQDSIHVVIDPGR